MSYKVAVITLSDSGASGKRADASGPLIGEMLSPKISPSSAAICFRTIRKRSLPSCGICATPAKRI